MQPNGKSQRADRSPPQYLQAFEQTQCFPQVQTSDREGEAQTRAKVKHPFHVKKHQFGYVETASVG